MKTYVIPQKESGRGTIHDIESNFYERDIVFKKGHKYACVLASYYGDCYSTHKTLQAAINAAYKKWDGYSLRIIDTDGNEQEY